MYMHTCTRFKISFVVSITFSTLFYSAKKSLFELRQLYFRMKDEVFAHDRLGFAYNTDALETILKEEFGTHMTMADVQSPK